MKYKREGGKPWREVTNWPVGTRGCRKCLTVKPFSGFHRNRHTARGYNTVCKECRKPVSKSQWSCLNLEYKILCRARSRAIQKELEFNLEVSDIIIPINCPVLGNKLIEKHFDWSPSIDRIDNSKGYIKGNIEIISNKANRIKSDGTLEEFEKLVIYLKERALNGALFHVMSVSWFYGLAAVTALLWDAVLPVIFPTCHAVTLQVIDLVSSPETIVYVLAVDPPFAVTPSNHW